LVDEVTFSCHKTIGKVEQHCAGALLMSEMHNRPNRMHQIAQRLGLYQPDRLLAADIYVDADDMAEGHAKTGVMPHVAKR
ncbi:hypothetical protein ACOI1H_25965, partial [Loktanella sp. DJP18]|uniref:hypothetical protein n=1 Tax=Loktanella sp. DJP18 TaxID=3409788 RepID=UPI003BB79B56